MVDEHERRDIEPHELTRWASVSTFSSRSAGQFAVAALEDADIPAWVTADDGGGTLPHLTSLTGGVHVRVPVEMVDAAREVLDGIEPAHGGDDDERLPMNARMSRWRVAFATILAAALAVTIASTFLTGGVSLLR